MRLAPKALTHSLTSSFAALESIFTQPATRKNKAFLYSFLPSFTLQGDFVFYNTASFGFWSQGDGLAQETEGDHGLQRLQFRQFVLLPPFRAFSIELYDFKKCMACFVVQNVQKVLFLVLATKNKSNNSCLKLLYTVKSLQ